MHCRRPAIQLEDQAGDGSRGRQGRRLAVPGRSFLAVGIQVLAEGILARDMFIGKRKRHSGGKPPGDVWVERSRRARRLREAIQMHDSGALSEEEFASLSSRLLEGGPVPETPDRAPETPRTRA
jgi:hypothetical protein